MAVTVSCEYLASKDGTGSGKKEILHNDSHRSGPVTLQAVDQWIEKTAKLIAENTGQDAQPLVPMLKTSVRQDFEAGSKTMFAMYDAFERLAKITVQLDEAAKSSDRAIIRAAVKAESELNPMIQRFATEEFPKIVSPGADAEQASRALLKFASEVSRITENYNLGAKSSPKSVAECACTLSSTPDK